MKNSWLRIWSSESLSLGFFCRMPEMSFCAAGESVEGRLYRTSFIHLYVSFRSRVSKGGLPHISVYLNSRNHGNHWSKEETKLMIQTKNASFSLWDVIKIQSKEWSSKICKCHMTGEGKQLWVKSGKKKYSHDTSKRPNIRLCAVALSVEHLGGQIVGSPTNCSGKNKHERTVSLFSPFFVW